MSQSFGEATSFRNSRKFTVNVYLITKILTKEQYKRNIPQGSYRQVYVLKFKDFSRTSKRYSDGFQGLKVYSKY